MWLIGRRLAEFALRADRLEAVTMIKEMSHVVMSTRNEMAENTSFSEIAQMARSNAVQSLLLWLTQTSGTKLLYSGSTVLYEQLESSDASRKCPDTEENGVVPQSRSMPEQCGMLRVMWREAHVAHRSGSSKLCGYRWIFG